MNTDPPDYSDNNDCEEPHDNECGLYGHWFEGYDEVSEICSKCGETREYEARDRNSRVTTTADDIHTCRTAGDHAFGLNRACLYCGKLEDDLPRTEREQYRSVRRERRGSMGNDGDTGLSDE
jgi:hypothetical protein